VTDTEIGSDLGDRAAGSNQIEDLASELFGVTLGHGHGSFCGRRDQKSSKPTPRNPGHIKVSDSPGRFMFLDEILFENVL
jgi:hypothetical protein